MKSVAKKKVKKRSSNASRGSSPTANNRSLNNARTSTPKKTKAKRSSQNGSSNQSPLARILSPGSTATTNMSFFSREKSSFSRAHSPHSTQSRSNLHQSQGVLNKSHSFVQVNSSS